MLISELEHGEKEELYHFAKEKYINLVLSDCSEAVSAMKEVGKFLYRGVRNAPDTQFKGKSRINRDTTGLPEVVSTLDKMMKAVGITATRTESMPTTTTLHHTKVFGEAFIIFPINGFSFSWSPKIRDFGIYRHANLRTLPDLFRVHDKPFMDRQSKDPKEIVIDKLQYTNQDLASALMSGNEIGIHGEYYAFDYLDYHELFLNSILK